MPIFIYQGRSRDGAKLRGEMEARNTNAVAEQLRSIGVIPLTIDEKKFKAAGLLANLNVSVGTPSKLKTDDLIFFSRQMYTLTKSSVPIMQALDGLMKTTDNKNLREVIASLRESLEEGLDLTHGMRRQKDVFPDLFVNLVNVGEATGKLAEVFDELSRYLQQEKDVKDQVKSAMRYPSIVLGVIGIGLVIVNVFIIPKFAEMYDSFNAELPLPTLALIMFSDFMISYWYLCLGIPVAAVIGFLKYIGTPPGRLYWHTTQLKLPLFGKLLLQSVITRFARGLAITGKAGVPMEQALKVIAPSVGNAFVEEKIDQMRAGVERGETITQSIVKMDLFPAIVVQMVSVGEDSGSLDEMIKEVADYYEREIAYTVKKLTAAIEPIMVFFIAGIVLILALGIFLPMISLLGAIH